MKNVLLLITICLFSCQGESSYQEAQLIGNWNAIEWNDLTNNKKINVKVDFTFEEENRYIGNYGSASEKGKYWIEGEDLHTIEDGKAEKKVKIKKLTQDTLIFGMNRVGSLEEIVLVKK